MGQAIAIAMGNVSRWVTAMYVTEQGECLSQCATSTYMRTVTSSGGDVSLVAARRVGCGLEVACEQNLHGKAVEIGNLGPEQYT